jgi:antirestriction protein ArdC
MNIYELVTDRILKQLEAGQVPWRKTWNTRLPKNLISGREYRGANILMLGIGGYGSRYWLTYRQAEQLGGYVRKGEKATPVVYWKWRTDEERARLRETKSVENPAPCVPFVSFVFNFEQVEGVERPADDLPFQRNETGVAAAAAYQMMPDKPEIIHGGASEPCYVCLLDRVYLPPAEQFKSLDAYFAALFHELCHATGHPRRLNRFADGEGGRKQRYSFEELVAEFGAAFLCAFTGISNPEMDALHASYINGWAQAIRADMRLVLRAATAAQRAADYIRGNLPEPEQIAAAA